MVEFHMWMLLYPRLKPSRLDPRWFVRLSSTLICWKKRCRSSCYAKQSRIASGARKKCIWTYISIQHLRVYVMRLRFFLTKIQSFIEWQFTTMEADENGHFLPPNRPLFWWSHKRLPSIRHLIVHYSSNVKWHCLWQSWTSAQHQWIEERRSL